MESFSCKKFEKLIDPNKVCRMCTSFRFFIVDSKGKIVPDCIYPKRCNCKKVGYQYRNKCGG